LPAFADDPFGDGGAARKISPPAHSSTANEAMSRAARPSHSFLVLLMTVSPKIPCMVDATGRCRIDAGQAGWQAAVTPWSRPEDRRGELIERVAVEDFQFAPIHAATSLPPGTGAGRG
jgi:hypothetical protein